MTSPSDDERRQRQAVRQALTTGAESLLAEQSTDEGSQRSLQERMGTLGFEGEAQKALDLLPLVLVAWSDGEIQDQERENILEVLQLRGLEGTAAFTVVQALLEKKPADAYMQVALQLLRELVADRSDGGASVVELCIDVAVAAGSFGTFDPVSPAERKAISEIADKLGPQATKEFRRRLDL